MDSDSHPLRPTTRELTRVFGRIGLLSFGGPAAQIALMHRELVEDRSWLDEDQFLRALSFCMLLPGPEAMQLATYAGWRLRGIAGGLIAGGLFVLPGAAVIAGLVTLYVRFGTLPAVQAAFLGIKSAVIVIVLQAVLAVSRRALGTRLSYALAVASFLAVFTLNVPFPIIIGLAALIGAMRPPAELPTGSPDPMIPTLASPLRVIAIWLPLWLLPLAALTLTGQTLLAQVGWFFAWLAVVTFGGAYAVLAYMTQTVVDSYQWISLSQMIDALGLAETTPGPLSLVTQFVAMLTGSLQGGPGLAIAAGVVALWATFVPCFLWIFLAGPYLEQISALPRLGAAMKAITAAVVGVILNLSVWFGLNVLFSGINTQSVGPLSFPAPDWFTLDPRALTLTLLAAALMLVLKQGLGRVLLICAVTGLALHLVLSAT
ncbi:chromate efflux transporter [Primorskyibacter sp. S87]|uniref:chromate efflux transporter n=1 Tax=Primorskyibacter sp. S87 TaxID=3415126 RepID=UPI003C7E19C0